MTFLNSLAAQGGPPGKKKEGTRIATLETRSMTELLSSVLTEITSQLIHIIGVAASPLIVLITYRAFRTRG